MRFLLISRSSKKPEKDCISIQRKGSGKTLLACCLANGLADREPISVKFISAPDFVELSKRSGNNDDLESIYNAGVLVLDDIGSETMKDWINTFFFSAY